MKKGYLEEYNVDRNLTATISEAITIAVASEDFTRLKNIPDGAYTVLGTPVIRLWKKTDGDTFTIRYTLDNKNIKEVIV